MRRSSMGNWAAMAARRCALALFDAAGVLAIALIALPVLVEPAYAYVDPSVMTYTIQALAGVAVALSAVAGVAFRRSRRAIMRALNIDENRNKVVDPAWSEVPGDAQNAMRDLSWFGHDVQMPGSLTGEADASAKREAKYSPAFGRRFVLSLVVAIFASLTLFVVAPYETLAGNTSSLTFGLIDVWQPIAIEAAAIAVVVAIAVSLLRGTAFNAALLVLFSFGLCCYVQALVLNGGLPTTDGRISNWGVYWGEALVSTLVWVALFAVPLVASKYNRKIVQTVAGVVAAALIIVQGVAVGSLLMGAFNEVSGLGEGEVPASRYLLTEKDMFTVSPKKNAIVFVLDTFDTQDMENLLAEDPSFRQELSGFTWFKNSLGSLSPTRYGCVFLWTGEYPHKDEPFEAFVSERYKRSPFLGDLESANYSIGLYTDPVGDYLLSDADRRHLIYDKTVNIKPPDPDAAPVLNIGGTLGAMAKCACYRDMPGVLKPFCYFVTDEINQAMVNDPANLKGADPSNTPYVMDDAKWYGQLREHGLELEQDSGYAGAYRFIHLLGTHVPYQVDANGMAASHDTSVEQQAHGSLTMVAYYLQQMRELGVYEDAEIIITADHGIWWESEPGPLPWVSSPLMLVKPAGSSEGELQESNASITAYDVLPTVVDYATGDASAYGPTIFEQNDPQRDRRYYLTHTMSNVDLEIAEYQVIGDVLDEGNWVKTGYTIDPSNTPRS